MARELLTRDDADPATLAAEAGYVKRIFKRIAPAVVWLTLMDGTTIGVTPEHEVYTEEQGWRYVSELEASSSLVDSTGAPLTIVAIEVDPAPRPVYNLETSCGTYFAQGVWAHNCFRTFVFGKSSLHVSISKSGLTEIEVGFMERAEDMSAMADEALDWIKGNGGTSAFLDTGPIQAVTESGRNTIASLARRANQGGSFLGGTVYQTGPNRFGIDWPTLP